MNKHFGVNLTGIMSTGLKGEIGRKGDLIWKIKEDLKVFKEYTMGAPLIMGTKTWDSLPFSLPGRVNVVVSRTHSPVLPEDFANHDNILYMRTDKGPAFFGRDLESCIRFAAGLVTTLSENKRNVFVIGGAALFKSCLDRDWFDSLLLTEVQAECKDADTFIDLELIRKNFHLDTHSKDHIDVTSNVSWHFSTYSRRKMEDVVYVE